MGQCVKLLAIPARTRATKTISKMSGPSLFMAGREGRAGQDFGEGGSFS